MKPRPLLFSDIKQSDIDRFFEFIDFEGCWLWTSALTNGGYARFWFNGITVLAHRFSYVLFSKKDDDGILMSRHTCNTTKCVNPDHLIKGTQLENVWDSLDSGRKVGTPILDDELMTIKELKDLGYSNREIGAMIGRARSSVHGALKRANDSLFTTCK